MTLLQPSLRDQVVDRIRLHRQVDKGPILLCEGGADRGVIREALANPPSVFPAGPRAVVLALVEEILDTGLGPAAAVVDRDLDDGVQIAQASGLPVLTFDQADLEAMLWSTPTLEVALDLMCSHTKLENAGGLEAVRIEVDTLILPIQRLRTANARLALGLDFDGIDLRKRSRPARPEISVAGVCDFLRQHRSDLIRSDLLSYANEEPLRECPHTALPLVRGKDRLAALGVLLRRQLGNLSFQEAHWEQIARTLYASTRRDFLVATRWVSGLEELIQAM